ncbi:amidohydrolase family protein [Euzebya sp.]|uniref:metal-dependent hydrolase family protein n=1 Tax=Euzebya sp. TaxID=1971409 RepID=UPI003518269C
MPTTDRPLTITNARIFDGSAADLVEGTIRVVDGVVVEIASSDAGAGDGEVVDARGRVVVPGLIDAHFHAYGISLDMLAMEATPMSYVASKAAQRLGRALRRGFTTVRDVAGGDSGLRRALDEGLIAGPRYLYTGRALSQTGGHADPRPPDLAIDLCCGHAGHTGEVVDGVDALRRAVRERFRTGAHAIKVMTSGGVMSLADPLRVPQYSAEEVRAVTDEATRRGSYVAAHAYSPEAIVHSVANGVRSIEHGNLLDADSAAAMAAAGAYLVPTLATYDAMDRRGGEFGLTAVGLAKNREVLDHGRTAIEIARAAGVPVGFGTDLMGGLETEQLSGLRLQHEVDGTLDLLRAATSVNAALLGRDDVGRIAPGAAADLIVYDDDPFETPSALWADGGRTVIQAGRVVA